MNNVKLLFGLFVVVAVAQWVVPVTMVMESERTLSEGTVYKFGIDGEKASDFLFNDYIKLYFAHNNIALTDSNQWKKFEPVFVTVTDGPDGFARVSSISKKEPAGNGDYFMARVDYVSDQAPAKVFLSFPFEKFYPATTMDEPSRDLFREILSDSTVSIYAKVTVHKGKALLIDVIADGSPIDELVKPRMKNQ